MVGGGGIGTGITVTRQLVFHAGRFEVTATAIKALPCLRPGPGLRVQVPVQRPHAACLTPSFRRHSTGSHEPPQEAPVVPL